MRNHIGYCAITTARCKVHYRPGYKCSRFPNCTASVSRPKRVHGVLIHIVRHLCWSAILRLSSIVGLLAPHSTTSFKASIVRLLEHYTTSKLASVVAAYAPIVQFSGSPAGPPTIPPTSHPTTRRDASHPNATSRHPPPWKSQQHRGHGGSIHSGRGVRWQQEWS